jgi:hypothetical protein
MIFKAMYNKIVWGWSNYKELITQPTEGLYILKPSPGEESQKAKLKIKKPQFLLWLAARSQFNFLIFNFAF